MLNLLIPPAAWAVSTSLSLPNEMPHPSGALDFILPRIRAIFESEDVKLNAMVAQLEILESKYTGIVLRGDYNRWRELEHVDLSAWHSLEFDPNARKKQIIRNRKRVSKLACTYTNNGLAEE
jgi:hypothetical protein